MVEFLSDVVLGYQLRKKIKSFDLQPKKSVRAFKTMAVILPEDLEVDRAVFEALAESLNLTSSKITFVEFSKKKLEERTTDERNRIFCSRKDISLSGRFTSEMRDFFNTKFDLVVNYFSVKAIFPELISINCSAVSNPYKENYPGLLYFLQQRCTRGISIGSYIFYSGNTPLV